MSPAARIIIKKQDRLLILEMVDGTCIEYAVELGRNWAADKAVEGDQATPVGEFYVCAKNPRSKFFLSLSISYPNAEDAERGLALRLIGAVEHQAIIAAIDARRIPPQHTALGGEIYVHGHAPAAGGGDWTRGCIALHNQDMQLVYDAAAIGTPVVITD